MDPNIFLFDRESTASVEAMNSANQRAHNSFSVNIVNTTIMLLKMVLKMESWQFKSQQDMAWKRKAPLTPHGDELLKKIPEKIDHHDYIIDCLV